MASANDSCLFSQSRGLLTHPDSEGGHVARASKTYKGTSLSYSPEQLVLLMTPGYTTHKIIMHVRKRDARIANEGYPQYQKGSTK